MGSDEIHPKIPKELADVITKPLSMISELSWESREVPADWKLANIVPIFKKGKKEDPGNYRPISLTLMPGTVMEKIILGSIEKHLKDNTVIAHSQHRFMRGKSCLSNLISFYDKVPHLADQGKPVDIILLDFSKAFNTVSHRILLDKMSRTQLDKHIMWWVSNQLTGRAQRVTVNVVTSDWQPVTTGLLQGSDLVHDLFNFFINDLDAGLKGILSKFADDTKLEGAADSLEGSKALQRNLDRLEDWAMTNHMKLDKGKCHILHLEWGNPGCSYRLGNEMLESSATERDLGVLTSSKLNVTQQCPSSQEGQQCPGRGGHQAKHCQPVKGGDCPTLLYTGKAHLEYCV
ncbi:RNA-directed DNA polymerase from mobile element jockey-like protein [Willisornis vidua]|uniref:RNA-directed DNA polymerase from mobile element jockey-like protein n=1 Tax=Willisornis vidua TaxID=1566151 RepID=A0ABQ9CXH7_9PASS|nr:RNA-directed DNA polymerase from mobile element jockey-like protein [Willisornis vidua]